MVRGLVFLMMIQSSLSFGAAPSKALTDKILNHKIVLSEVNRLNPKYSYHCAVPDVEGDIMWECPQTSDYNKCTFSVMIVCEDMQERIWGLTQSGEVKITSIHVD